MLSPGCRGPSEGLLGRNARKMPRRTKVYFHASFVGFSEVNLFLDVKTRQVGIGAAFNGSGVGTAPERRRHAKQCPWPKDRKEPDEDLDRPYKPCTAPGRSLRTSMDQDLPDTNTRGRPRDILQVRSVPNSHDWELCLFPRALHGERKFNSGPPRSPAID
jgi:hypothetical protein